MAQRQRMSSKRHSFIHSFIHARSFMQCSAAKDNKRTPIAESREQTKQTKTETQASIAEAEAVVEAGQGRAGQIKEQEDRSRSRNAFTVNVQRTETETKATTNDNREDNGQRPKNNAVTAEAEPSEEKRRPVKKNDTTADEMRPDQTK